jgi:hypothetical protein
LDLRAAEVQLPAAPSRYAGDPSPMPLYPEAQPQMER